MLMLEPTAVAAQVLYEDSKKENTIVKQEVITQDTTLETLASALKTWKTQLNTDQPSTEVNQRRDQSIQSQAYAIKQQVISFDVNTKAKFAETLAQLQAKNMPEEIIQRHTDTVATYQKDMTTLLTKLDAIISAKDDTNLAAQLEDTLAYLKPFLALNDHPEFDPTELPFGVPKSKNREPIQNATALKKQLPVDPSEVTPKGRSSAPDASYLVATEDVKITDEIKALAEELDHDPVKIYNWVYDNIRFIPTYKSIQGSQQTLDNNAGNATDTSSLLIALLRASGIHSRYAYGTVRIPAEKVMNWVGGVTVPEAALHLIAQGGIPVAYESHQGRITHFNIEHMWVDAWIDFIPSRGAKHIKGDKWVSMDASFKQYEFTEGMDIENNVEFDKEGFVKQFTDNIVANEAEGWTQSNVDQIAIQAQLENYQAQIEQYIKQTNPDATIDDVLGIQATISPNRPTFAAGLPYEVKAEGNTFKTLPDKLRHYFKLSLSANEPSSLGTSYATGYPVINYKESLPNLAGKRLTLSFEPYSNADRKLLESYLPNVTDGQEVDLTKLPTSFPGYLIYLKAQLKLDGEIVKQNGKLAMGQKLMSTIGITKMNGDWYLGHKNPIAGEFYAFGIDLQGVTQKEATTVKERMEATKAKVEAEQFTNVTKDDFIGDILYMGALTYFAINDLNLKMINKGNLARAYRHPSFGTFSTNLIPVYSLGIPQEVKPSGILVDMDTIVQSLWAEDDNALKTKQFVQQIGMTASALEHLLPEKLFSSEQNPGEGISAIKALNIASEEGQRIYKVTQMNFNTVLPQLSVSNEIKDEIRTSVALGKIVTISQHNIAFNNWIGAGYIITDPDTGAGAYKITGGANGGLFLSSGLQSFLFGGIAAGAIAFGAPAAIIGLFLFGFVLALAHLIYSEGTEDISLENSELAVGLLLATLGLVAAGLFAFGITITILTPAAGFLAAAIGFVFAAKAVLKKFLQANLSKIRYSLHSRDLESLFS